jgi:hypothetical protein
VTVTVYWIMQTTVRTRATQTNLMQMLPLMTWVMFAIPALVAAVVVRIYVRRNANWIVTKVYMRRGD